MLKGINELEKFHVNWNDLQELMQSERSRTKRALYTETDTLWYNLTQWTFLIRSRERGGGKGRKKDLE